MKYFTIQECVRSAKAVEKHIDNTPSPEIEAHLRETVERLADPLREAWAVYCTENGLGTPAIHVSSGYRCPALNKAVGGVPTSAHCFGYALDLQPLNNQMRAFKRFCREFLADKDFDQLISEGEKPDGRPSWMHVGYKHPDGVTQRKQLLSMIDGKYYPMTD